MRPPMFDLNGPTLHAAAYDTGQVVGRMDKATGRDSADLALEAWLHQSPGNDIYADSFRSGYAAGNDR